MEYPLEEKEKRIQFIKSLAWELRREVFESLEHQEAGNSLLEKINRELHVDDEMIVAAVQYYYDVLLTGYKRKHSFDEDELADRDKMAAFMGLAILTLRPFRSLDGTVTFIETEVANEQLALRFASVVLDGGDGGPGSPKPLPQAPVEIDIPPIVIRNLLYNFSMLGELARQRSNRNQPLDPTDPIMGWVVQAMQLFALAFGRKPPDEAAGSSV